MSHATAPRPMTAADAPMHYTELHPCSELKPWVAAHWHFRVDDGAGTLDHWIPLTGGAMLAVTAGGEAIFVGPRTAPLQVEVHGGERDWGCHFWPGTAGALLGVDLDALREQVVPAAQLLDPAWVERLAAALSDCEGAADGAAALDAALGELAPAAPLDAEVMTAVFRLLQDHGRSPSDLAREVGLSPRHLRRRFRAAVGLSAKELARVERLRAAAVGNVVGQRPWVDLAAAGGYADQAHLVREFRHLLGLTPTGFDAHARRIRHGDIVR